VIVDPVTHALASYTLKRAAFPRLGRAATVAVIVAGTVADVDAVSGFVSPAAFVTWHRTFCHSIAAALVFAGLAVLPFLALHRNQPEKRTLPRSVFFPALAAALLHSLLDGCQFQAVELLCAFSPRRFALDWLPRFDLWLLVAFLAAILLPMLGSLVTEEIGAKTKGPRGRPGAVLAMIAVVLYVGGRALLHSEAVAVLDARTYRGESPKRVAAFPAGSSLFTLTGIVETERALHDVEVSMAPGARFDPEAARTSYKPEPSPALGAALRTATAQRFLAYARFPKASVEKTSDGYRIILRAFPYDADAPSGRAVMAVIDADLTGKVIAEALVWDPASQQAG
jgi:membrane-bound metal-dependent hydrolase YbcI (DUF457 family)